MDREPVGVGAEADPARVDGDPTHAVPTRRETVRPGREQREATRVPVAQRRGAAGCVLLGDPAYYRRFGFGARPGLVLPGVPSEYFQAILFRGSCPVGQVRYGEAFDATE